MGISTCLSSAHVDAAPRCAYEAYVGLRDGRMLYDIATTQDWLLRM